MAAPIGIDPRIYGGKDLPEPTDRSLDVPDSTDDADKVPFGTSLKGSPLEQQGQAALAANRRVPASIGDAAYAAASEWKPFQMREAMSGPKFEPDPKVDPVGYINKNIPYELTPDQYTFMEGGKNTQDLIYRHGLLDEQTKNAQMEADHRLVSFAVGGVDPLYAAINLVSGGAGTAAKLLGAGAGAARTVGAVTGAAAALGANKIANTVHPTSTTEMVIDSMVNGAFGYHSVRGGKFVPKDPEFPSKELHGIANDLKNSGQVIPDTADVAGSEVPDPQVQTRPLGEPVGPAPLTESRVPATGNGNTPVKYAGGDTSVEYNPELNLSKGEQSALVKDGRVMQVQSVADIADHVPSVARGRTVIDPEAKAVYLPAEDRVFLVKDNIKPTDDIKGILLHEYGVHMNAERVLGTEQLGKMLSSLEDMAIAGNARAKRAFADVPADTPRHLVREEALGYYVERNHGDFGDNIINRFIAGTRALLRKSGLSGLKYSENDLMQLVRKAAKGGEKAAKTSFDATFPHAWHGSAVPGIHALDTAYMGTGEGAQAYGWGHYLTSEKGTALDYRNKESLRRGIPAEQGGLYRVKINAQEHEFLNLETREQSPEVSAALTKLGVKEGVTGKTAYDYLSRTLGGKKQASEALYNEGVKGNKYSTGRTRLSDDKSSNYVLFHNDVADIAARYSKSTATEIKITPAQQASIHTMADAGKVVEKSLAKTVAKYGEWSLSKTMGKFGETSKRVSNFLVDSPTDRTGNSVENQHRAIKADLDPYLHRYEDALLGQMAAQGAGTWKQMFGVTKSLEIQKSIEKQVYEEMIRRNRLSRDGKVIDYTGVPEHIKGMADHLDGLSKAALDEMKRSGVAGAEAIEWHPGHTPRRWDYSKMELMERKLIAGGATPAAAKATMIDTISIGMQRANGWDADLAKDIAKATYDRARAKSYFEDATNISMDKEGLSALKGMLTDSGIAPARMERILEVMGGRVDEAGKASFAKHRVDVALDETIRMPDGTEHTIADMLDTNLANTSGRYTEQVSTQSAFARKGLTKPTDIANLRAEYIASVGSEAGRKEAAKLFDNTVSSLQGNPVGEELPDFMRKTQAVTQMVGLAYSALWQVTEYATMMMQYGGLKVFGSMLHEMPGVRALLGDKLEAGHLQNMLARNSSSDMRLRPFLQKMEDGYAIAPSDSVQLGLMQAKQWVPYLNAMKYVQGHQARVAGNVIMNTFERAASGDAKALHALGQYGLESHTMVDIRADIAQHGMDTAKWSDKTWEAVRAPLTKMMDDSVLRNRRGEIPAFAQFSSTGKFLFTFRSFVLSAHNKVMMGTLHNDGFAGLGLLMAYQLPLTIAASAAANTISGKPPMNMKKLISTALSQMSSMGLISELIGVLGNTKQQFGSPGTIAWDRAYKLIGAIASGNGQNITSNAISTVPLLSIIAPVKTFAELIKDHKAKPKE